MGKKACGSGQNPDEWEPVDYPDPTVPESTLPNWTQLVRLLLLRAWLRGEWSDLGKYLHKFKNS